MVRSHYRPPVKSTLYLPPRVVPNWQRDQNATRYPLTPGLFRVTTIVGLGCGVMDVMLAVLQRVPSYENLMLVIPAVLAAAQVPALLLVALWSGVGLFTKASLYFCPLIVPIRGINWLIRRLWLDRCKPEAARQTFRADTVGQQGEDFQ